MERPALAGQAPHSKQRHSLVTYPTFVASASGGNHPGYFAQSARLYQRMGAYGLDRVSMGGMAEIDVLPGLGGPVYADKQLVVSRTTAPNGLAFAGEIDSSNSHAVGTAITSAKVPDRDFHVDVSSLLFCDISGIRAFVTAAEAMPRGRRLLLHGMPPQLETVIKVVGWNRMPALVVCKCGDDS